MSDEEAICCSCGNEIAYDDGSPTPYDDCCFCELCGGPMCDDCNRESGSMAYCVNCYTTEIAPTITHEDQA